MPAPSTTTLSPSDGAARLTACTATETGSTIAASSYGTPSGTLNTMCCGTVRNSANAPWRR